MPTLEKNIEKYSEEFQNNISSELMKKLDDGIKELLDKELSKKSLKVGDKIPEFTLSNQDSKIVNIKDIIEKNNYTVISFFRGSWSPYCNIELDSLQKIVSQLKILHTSLITLSPQTPDKSSYIKDKYALDFEILYDKNNTIAKEFKVSYALSDELISVYEELKIDILEANRNGTYELPLPATYIVNKNYEIIYAFVNEDYRKRCEPKTILDAIKKDMINKK